jgi:hypothetical protein
MSWQYSNRDWFWACLTTGLATAWAVNEAIYCKDYLWTMILAGGVFMFLGVVTGATLVELKRASVGHPKGQT